MYSLDAQVAVRCVRGSLGGLSNLIRYSLSCCHGEGGVHGGLELVLRAVAGDGSSEAPSHGRIQGTKELVDDRGEPGGGAVYGGPQSCSRRVDDVVVPVRFGEGEDTPDLHVHGTHCGT